MVLLSKDPTADIKNAKSILFVMKDGKIIDESQLPLAGGRQPRRFFGHLGRFAPPCLQHGIVAHSLAKILLLLAAVIIQAVLFRKILPRGLLLVLQIFVDDAQQVGLLDEVAAPLDVKIVERVRWQRAPPPSCRRATAFATRLRTSRSIA